MYREWKTKVLRELLDKEEGVDELAEMIGLNKMVVSKILEGLRMQELVDCEKIGGKVVWYVKPDKEEVVKVLLSLTKTGEE